MSGVAFDVSNPQQETNGTSAPGHQLVNFKKEPTIVPAQEVTRLETFPSGTGGLGDIWKCTWSQQSGTCLKVSVRTDESS
jgi:hypothetical protein